MEEKRYPDGKKGDSYQNYLFMRNMILILNVVLAVLIIGSSFLLIETNLGSSTLAFGFVMLTTTVILRILQKW